MKFSFGIIVALIVLYNGDFVVSESFSNRTQSLNYVTLVEDFGKSLHSHHQSYLPDENTELFLNSFFPNNRINPELLFLILHKSSFQCLQDLVYTFDNLKSLGWALKMIDSYGKPEAGILGGNTKWFGNYRECVDIYAPPGKINNTSVGDFTGQYCTLNVNANITQNMSLPLMIGVCLPSSCDVPTIKADIDFILPFLPKNISEEVSSLLPDMKLTCPVPLTKWTPAAITVIFLLSVFLVLATLGTLITVYESFAKANLQKDLVCVAAATDKAAAINGDVEKQSSAKDKEAFIVDDTNKKVLPVWLEKCNAYLNCFCFITNGEKLLNTDSSEGQLPSLHGIRFLSMSWVILCHTYAFGFGEVKNMGDLMPVVHHWHFQIILNGFYSVDSFFLLSGFLVGYLFFMQAAKTNGKIPWLYFYVHRYLRLTPVYMLVLAFFTVVMPYMGSGPIWPSYDADPNCKKNWWWNLLYINNFQPSAQQCMSWTWYLANDMQFYIISPLFLITLWRWPVTIGYALMGTFFAASFLANFIITYHYNLMSGLGDVVNGAANVGAFLVKWGSFFDKVYVKPYTRISPYLIGIVLAYYLFKRKQNKTGKNSWVVLCAGWIIASVVTLACMFGTYDRQLTVVESSFYNALNRSCFACGLSWVIYVCLTGQGGFVNKLLSWKFLIPLSRLTFCAYMVHPVVQSVYYISLKSLLEFSNDVMVIHYLSFLVLSYIVALCVSLLLESPLIRLEKIVRNKFSS